MSDAVAWIAPLATMIAAVMTAANLGARVTGWGFVIFVIGSVSWSVLGISTGQTNLLWTNIFLTIVNLIGVWRWLGRQAKYDDGSAAAARRSARARVPTLFSVGSLMGTKVSGLDDEVIGTVVDAMAKCDGATLEYVVISTGGMGGIGERLHALDPASLTFTHDGVIAPITANEVAALPLLDPDQWPHSLRDAQRGRVP